MSDAKKEELLNRECGIGGGTKVTNCVMHMSLPLTNRPSDCRLCSTDIQNRLGIAIAINEWLNVWKEDAEKYLKSGEGVATSRKD